MRKAGSHDGKTLESSGERVLARARPEARPSRVVARSRHGVVFLDLESVWAFEAAARLVFVHTPRGRFDLDISLAHLETELGERVCRAHRNWLVNPVLVRSMERDGSKVQLLVGPETNGDALRVPVSRAHLKAVRDTLMRNATGLRKTRADEPRVSHASRRGG